jgi:hypothetical protein
MKFEDGIGTGERGAGGKGKRLSALLVQLELAHENDTAIRRRARLGWIKQKFGFEVEHQQFDRPAFERVFAFLHCQRVALELAVPQFYWTDPAGARCEGFRPTLIAVLRPLTETRLLREAILAYQEEVAAYWWAECTTARTVEPR